MKRIILTTGIVAISLFACKTKEKATSSAPPAKTLDCTTSNYTYETDIKPIMAQNCTHCHNTNMKAGYDFGDIASVKRAAGNGELMGSIKHMEGFDPMPANDEPLDQATINKLDCWIKNGMK